MTAPASSPTIADLTTLGVGGRPRALVRVESEADLVAAVRDCDARSEPWLLIGGGSNLVVGDADFDGTVIQIATAGVTADSDNCGGAWVEVAAGEDWDQLVHRSIQEGWTGLEALSGIPGRVGATPVQNVGAYGAEVADTIARVRVWDRVASDVRVMTAADCGFGYRTSIFKRERFADGSPRYVVLSVTLQLPRGDLSAPVRYAELADAVGVQLGDRVPTADLRQAVLALRRRKGMVLDASDPDTRSVGSFFTNPIVTAQVAGALAPDAPRWEMPAGLVKVSAAWLLQSHGFGRGFALRSTSRIGLSHKHCLAITNRGGGTCAEVIELAEHIRTGVHTATGIWLEPEPTLVNAR